MSTFLLSKLKNTFSISLKILLELFNLDFWLNSHRQFCLPKVAHLVLHAIRQ